MNRRKLLALLLAGAVLGLLVLVLNPDYRETFLALLRGSSRDTPLWQTNARYYENLP